MTFRALLFIPLLLTAACASKRIPGTELEDTDDTRAILAVMERYRSALEAKDAKGVQALVAKTFFENSGTEDPSDDLTYANLPQQLANSFPELDNPKVELSVRKVNIQDEVATAIYFFNISWKMPRLTNRGQNDSDLEQMVLQKIDGQWKIVSGI